jgi:hypothetical protein
MKIGRRFTHNAEVCEFLGYASKYRMRVRVVSSGRVVTILSPAGQRLRASSTVQKKAQRERQRKRATEGKQQCSAKSRKPRRWFPIARATTPRPLLKAEKEQLRLRAEADALVDTIPALRMLRDESRLRP